MSDLNKLGTALSVAFVVSLLALVAELVYVLWRRRLFHLQTSAADAGDVEYSVESAAASKELLYFLCWKQQARVEPDKRIGSGRSDRGEPEEVIDMLKLQEMYGPSRVLFTIKEEEREEAESEKSLSSAEKVIKKTRRVTLEGCFMVAGDSAEVDVRIAGDLETTPYSTPCDSPLYYTPTASPARESEGESGLP
ncbi:Zinc finger protein [Actinidia chinensis var. chinensis]|uniref:Zinc finger protein n=1 Tax=Actinidia chinensis var. chinensis TaxID=1590841 RepID=A0A2R6Q430_ACTCC|nr:Zinc finger protein [Actinidia chinensis var. chinensis]